jgi:hypothetical protein
MERIVLVYSQVTYKFVSSFGPLKHQNILENSCHLHTVTAAHDYSRIVPVGAIIVDEVLLVPDRFQPISCHHRHDLPFAAIGTEKVICSVLRKSCTQPGMPMSSARKNVSQKVCFNRIRSKKY